MLGIRRRKIADLKENFGLLQALILLALNNFTTVIFSLSFIGCQNYTFRVYKRFL